MSYNNPYGSTKVQPYAPATPLHPVESPISGTTAPIKPLSANQMNRLLEQGYTHSLARSLEQTKEAFAQRIWVVDNSGSMNHDDGHRIVHNFDRTVQTVRCTRWEEIRECVNYHIRLASLLEAPTTFRLLNPTKGIHQLSVGQADSQDKIMYEANNAINELKKVRPLGCTPLTQHIMEIHRQISGMAASLQAKGQRVAIIIATDGLPTDERGYGGAARQHEFVEALRLLEGLPVWVVIRLCTDEEEVVSFYNDIDEILELSIDVLDDYLAESEEVYAVNPWLNYALPLHRMREMGYQDRLFDLIDNRRLTKNEIRDFIALLFGGENFDGVPDPSVDWDGFMKEVTHLLKNEKNQWHPIKKRAKPWVSVNKLNRIYGNASCVIL